MSEFFKVVEESTSCDAVVFDLIKYEGDRNVPYAEVVILTEPSGKATLEISVESEGKTLLKKVFNVGLWDEDFDIAFVDKDEYMYVYFNGNEDSGDYRIIFKNEDEGVVVDVVDVDGENDIIPLGWLSEEDLLGEREWEKRYA